MKTDYTPPAVKSLITMLNAPTDPVIPTFMQSPKPIVIIGSINMDMVCRTSHRPMPGETLLGKDLAMVHGGKGANQAVAAARLGAEVHLIGRVGDDEFGRHLLSSLQQNGVNTEHVTITANTSSGVAVIVVDDTGENSIIVIPGANGHLTSADIDAAQAIITNAACVVMQLETPYKTIEHAIKLCRQLGTYTILDPAPAPTAMPTAFYQVDLFTPNQAEARTILANQITDDDISVGQQLLNRGAQTIVLKLGIGGAMLLDQQGKIATINSFPINVLDTTAAGDAFTAGLAVGLSEKMEMTAAIQFANAAGALACTILGAQPSLPTRAAVDALRIL